jgi:hypothetical protein
MRLTTKIISGIILSIFTISLIFIIGFSFTDRKNYEGSYLNNINLSQENKKGIELPPYKTILIDEVAFESNGRYRLSANCNIDINPTSESHNSDMMFVPESIKDLISFDTYGDTLKITLSLHNIHTENKKRLNFYSGFNINLNISKIDVISKVPGLSVTANNIQTDSMKIKSSGNIFINSCKADVIEPSLFANYRQLLIKNSEMIKLNLDLDNISNWKIENCNIEEENLTGSKTHRITQRKDESKIINWHPKNDKAILNITIESDTARIIFP